MTASTKWAARPARLLPKLAARDDARAGERILKNEAGSPVRAEAATGNEAGIRLADRTRRGASFTNAPPAKIFHYGQKRSRLVECQPA